MPVERPLAAPRGVLVASRSAAARRLLRPSPAPPATTLGATEFPTEDTRLDVVSEEVTELEPDDVEEAEPQPDPELMARRAAALAHVRKFGDPVLRTRARPVERIDDALRAEIARMGELMNDALGVGLAATQLGVLHRVLVYRVQQQAPVSALINPEIEWRGGEEDALQRRQGPLDGHPICD